MHEALDALVHGSLQEVLGPAEVYLPLLGLRPLAEGLDERQVIDGLDAADGFADQRPVAHVPRDELGALWQILRRRQVEDAHLAPGLEKPPGQERAGETRPAGHQIHAAPP